MERPSQLPGNPLKSYELGFKTGTQSGFDDLKNQALTFLQHKYVTADDRPDRGSERGEAILQLARELADHLDSIKPKKVV